MTRTSWTTSWTRWPGTVSRQGSLLPHPAAANSGSSAGRWRAHGGDVFAAVPEGGDLYLLKNILHDWPDEDCLRILRTVRAAMTPGIGLLVDDAVLPADGTAHPAVPLGIVMLTVLKGRERTAAEFEDLLTRSGFPLDRIVPAPSLSSIVEARAV
ncbi:hypothetical protein JNO44_34690 [Streptomyces noursei]|nr:hypothetical protein JNO44_34690 [Streptomyces noursei]